MAKLPTRNLEAFAQYMEPSSRMTASQLPGQHHSTDLQTAIDGAAPSDQSEDAPALVTARRVLATEASALTALAVSLGPDFVRAMEVLDEVEGRVVVTGMGKSGHIARKMAATLSSTGTPAQFVHPGEASHGDLGMILVGDVVIALSNSGETTELADLVAHCKRFTIPLIAITGKADSTLADNADIALVYPDSPEACPMGLAPTTSTTVALALGDALAVALLEHRGFSADDFRNLHPGGKLGQRLLKVQDIMHKEADLPLAVPDTPMSEALLIMTAKSFGCVAITELDGSLAGVITDGDLRRNMQGNMLEMRAGDVMTTGPTTVNPYMLASEALGIMNSKSITNLVVLEDNRPVGILHIHDCLRAGVA